MKFATGKLNSVFFLVILDLGITSTAFAQECKIIYVSPLGADTGIAGTKANPASLSYALMLADSVNNHFWLSSGTYIISNEINMNSGFTLEGGFDSLWQKTNKQETIILRDTNNISVNPNRIVAVECTGISNFGIHNLKINVAGAIGDGVSVYGLHISNCSDYDLSRITVIAGNASDGSNGVDGINGINGANGQVGQPGDEDGGCCTGGGTGGDSSFVGSNSGGNGGNGGARGTGVCFPSGGTTFPGDTGFSGMGISGGIGGPGGIGSCFSNSFGCDQTPAMNGANGVDGGNGTNGANGDSGVYSFGNYFFQGNGQDGQNGENGSGGGGGGGGGSQGCQSICFGNTNGAGAGGGGGGEGGQGGTGATGGKGGGSSFGIYINANGANSFLKDSYFDSGMQGNGGQGDTIGGIGSTGGSGGGMMIGCDIGSGGNGGKGGNGGNGGKGGNGVAGVSLPMYEDTAGLSISQSDVKTDPEPAIFIINSGCTFSDVDFYTNATGVIEWFFDSSATNTSVIGDSVSIQFSQTGSHTVTLSVDGVPYIFSDFVEIFSGGVSFQPTISGADSVCAGSATTFSTANTVDSLEWKIYDGGNIITETTSNISYTFNSAGTYNITLQTIFSCCGKSTTDTFVVNVFSSAFPDVYVFSNDSVICNGYLATFFATAINGGNNPSFQWLVNGNNTGQTSNVFSSANLNNGDIITCEMISSALCSSGSPAISLPFTITVYPTANANATAAICNGDSILLQENYQTSAGTYSDTLLTINGCDSVITTTLTVNPKPTVLLSGSDDSICIGEPVIFTASPPGFDNYEFFDGTNALQNGASNMFIDTPLADMNNVSVIATDSGCVSDSSNNISVVVNAIPIVLFIAGPTGILVGDTIFFSSNTSGTNNSYLWDFGDSTTSALASPYHIYSSVGNYTITLIVTSPEGCADTLSKVGYISVWTGQKEFAIYDSRFTVYPNPFSSEINISVNSETENKMQISLMNLLGEKIISERKNVSKGEQLISLPIGKGWGWVPGMYLLEMDFNGTKQYSKLIYQE